MCGMTCAMAKRVYLTERSQMTHGMRCNRDPESSRFWNSNVCLHQQHVRFANGVMNRRLLQASVHGVSRPRDLLSKHKQIQGTWWEHSHDMQPAEGCTAKSNVCCSAKASLAALDQYSLLAHCMCSITCHKPSRHNGFFLIRFRLTCT